MLHIYRQITSLRRARSLVIAQKRENEETFPFDNLRIVRKPTLHFLRRIWFKQILDRPWQISRAEVHQLQEVLRENNARVLHIYFGNVAILLLPLVRAWARPTVVSFHGADVLVDLHKPAYRRATQEMLAAVKRVLVRSESLRRAVIKLGCAPEKIIVQRTGIPLEQFSFCGRSSPVNARWHLLQAGRLIPKKGVATTLRAFAKFREVFPASELTIAGEGPLLGELQQLARELEIENAVRFAGFVSQTELRKLFYAADIFLHPSETGPDGNQEGVPNSMLEAMATGLPVFATRHGGIAEAIEQGQSGELVHEGDYKSLADVLIDAARNPQRLTEMGRAASRRVAAEFDQKKQTERLEEIYLREIK